jgi:hypothetical protein
MPPRSTGIQVVGEALQSETSRKISDRYQPTKSISTSITNPPSLVPQDLHRQSATSEVSSDNNGMGLILFNNNHSGQTQSLLHRFEKEGSPSQVVRKRLKTADGNVMPIPVSIEPLHFPVDQLANTTVNPVITFSPAISAAILDPFQPSVRRDGDTIGIPRSFGLFPTTNENSVVGSSPGLQRSSRPYMFLNTAPSNDQVGLITRTPDLQPPPSGGTPIATTQRR